MKKVKIKTGTPVLVSKHMWNGDATFVRCCVVRAKYGPYAVPVKHQADSFPGEYLNEHSEGVVWCRGWSGQRADALRVAVALL